MSMIQTLGYSPKFNSKEKFYYTQDEQTGTYEELEDILKITFKMYEDFKAALAQ